MVSPPGGFSATAAAPLYHVVIEDSLWPPLFEALIAAVVGSLITALVILRQTRASTADARRERQALANLMAKEALANLKLRQLSRVETAVRELRTCLLQIAQLLDVARDKVAAYRPTSPAASRDVEDACKALSNSGRSLGSFSYATLVEIDPDFAATVQGLADLLEQAQDKPVASAELPSYFRTVSETLSGVRNRCSTIAGNATEEFKSAITQLERAAE